MCFNDTADQILSGGIDNEVKVSKISLVVVITLPFKGLKIELKRKDCPYIEISKW